MIKFYLKKAGLLTYSKRALKLGLVVKWISHWSSEPRFGVRIPARPPRIYVWTILKKYFGYPPIPEAGIRG